jgi:AcrR family transcriptional regulator
MAEFSTYGIAGARVDRIAKTAGCNKNLIYIYFENKETLFSTILQKHLTRVYEDLSFTPDDLPGYAARVFDFAMAHPDLMRGPGGARRNSGRKNCGIDEGAECRSGRSGVPPWLPSDRHHDACHRLDGDEPVWSVSRP